MSLFFTLLIICLIKVVLTEITMKGMNWNLLLLKPSTLKVEYYCESHLWDTHPWIDWQTIRETIRHYLLHKLLENISKEQKSIFLLGDFIFNFFSYNEHNPTNESIDSLASNSCKPLNFLPTRIASHFNILVNNMYVQTLLFQT